MLITNKCILKIIKYMCWLYNLFSPKSLVDRKWIPKKKEKKKRCPQHGMTSNVIHKLYEDHATV